MRRKDDAGPWVGLIAAVMAALCFCFPGKAQSQARANVVPGVGGVLMP